MRRATTAIAAAFLAFAALAASAAAKPAARPPVNQHRKSPYVGALAIDAQSGRTLFADRAGDIAYPASVTKIMTAYLVLDDVAEGKLRLSDAVTASPVKNALDRHLRQPSSTGLRAGASMTVDEMLKALMVNSANDAAIYLAEKCSGTTAAFVERMNAKARELGMTSTVYHNPNGLPPFPGSKTRDFNVSTCNDLAKLARAVLRNHPEMLNYTALKVWKPTAMGRPYPDARNQITWVNHNNVMVKNKLKVVNPDGTEAADGLKTGYIEAGGSSVVLTGVRNGRRAVVIVLGSSSSKERDEKARFLLEDALDSFSL